jgi:hypothetical protein
VVSAVAALRRCRLLAQIGHPDTLNPCGGKADIDRMRRNVR